MKIEELKKINPDLAEKIEKEGNLKHRIWTDWVSPDFRSYQASMNNNGPAGWIKITL